MRDYTYIKEGEILQDGDEYDNGRFVIGDWKHCLWPRSGMPCPKEIMHLKPRRKKKPLESDKKFNNLIVDEE